MSLRDASSAENSTSSVNCLARPTAATAASNTASLLILSFLCICISDVAIKVCILDLSATETASPALSISSFLALARPAITGPRALLAIPEGRIKYHNLTQLKTPLHLSLSLMYPRFMGLSFYKPAYRDKQSLTRPGRRIKYKQDNQHNLRLCNDYNKQEDCSHQRRKRFSLAEVYILKAPVLDSAYHQIGKEISHNKDYYGSYLLAHL